jgi:outer membrane protein OmpA-like peptidoglycan-associated protein
MSLKKILLCALGGLLLVGLGCASLPEKPPVEAQPLQLGDDEWRVTDHVVIVTDASGTMYVNETFPTAKALTRSFVAAMPAADVKAKNPGAYTAGAIGFGGDERAATPQARFDRAALGSHAAGLQVMGDISGYGGTTPLDAVIREAGASLGEARGRAALVVVSDGLPDDGLAALSAARRLAAARKGQLCIHTVQTGTDASGTAFLQTLSQVTPCGSFRNAEELATGYELQQLARVVFAGPAPPPPVAAAGPCAGVVRLRGIEFEFDDDRIRDSSQPVLDVAVERLAECPQLHVTITGHTDSIGGEDYNVDLSYRRAVATQRYLVEHGIEASRLETEGLGESDPIADNTSAEGRSMNRRVELAPLR